MTLYWLKAQDTHVCISAQALRQVEENQSTETLRTVDENATEDLMLDDGFEEDEDVLPVDEEEEILQAAAVAGDDDSADFVGAGKMSLGNVW